MTAPEPLGPALAAELGGTWDEKCEWVRLREHVVWSSVAGRVFVMPKGGGCSDPIGTFSDGVEALAAEARRLGVA